MSQPGRAKTVLVIEDEFTIRDTLKQALESDGYQVITAENGRDGLDRLRAGADPDLILLDMMMPIMSGREFLSHVKADCVLAPTPILIVSATVDDKDALAARAFIKKPPDLEVLLAMVAKYIR